MFAVIQTGGKQYKVSGGTILDIEKIEGDVGASVTLDNVLMVGGESSNSIGEKAKGGAVTVEILAQEKGDKVIIFKKKRRHNYRRKNGHRQLLTKVRITSISLDGKEVAKAEPQQAKKTPAKAEAAPKAAKAAPAKKAAAPKAAAEKKPAAEKKAAAPKKPAAKKAAAKEE